jgi:hypothetical protein
MVKYIVYLIAVAIVYIIANAQGQAAGHKHAEDEIAELKEIIKKAGLDKYL